MIYLPGFGNFIILVFTPNEELIRSFKLDGEPVLTGRDRFGSPEATVFQKLIPRRGHTRERPVTYYIYGTGNTSVIEEQLTVSFEYYPPVITADTSLLGYYGVSAFVRSMSPLNPLGDESIIRNYVSELIKEEALGRVDNLSTLLSNFWNRAPLPND
jgi:hypothetical protein